MINMFSKEKSFAYQKFEVGRTVRVRMLLLNDAYLLLCALDAQ